MTRRRKLAALAGVLALAGALAAVPSCLALERDPHEVKIGAPAPAIALLDMAGKPFAIDGLRARDRLPVLVFYRGHW
jgi:hypothetical protein